MDQARFGNYSVQHWCTLPQQPQKAGKADVVPDAGQIKVELLRRYCNLIGDDANSRIMAAGVDTGPEPVRAGVIGCLTVMVTEQDMMFLAFFKPG
jgi:hypothetical protein